MYDFRFVPAIISGSVIFISIMTFCVVIFIECVKDDRELKGRINEKNLQALKKFVKKSKHIDQQQADRISLLLEETLSLLRQKKISR